MLNLTIRKGLPLPLLANHHHHQHGRVMMMMRIMNPTIRWNHSSPHNHHHNPNSPSNKKKESFEILERPAPGSPFHLAIPVNNMKTTRHFYGSILGLKEGRRSEDKWQDYSLAGHQIVCHFVGEHYRCVDYYNPVDKDDVPVPHFGLVLTEPEFQHFRSVLEKHHVHFIVKPHKRFEGQPGEQWTMFFKDPSGNNLEFKSMTNPDYLFAKYNVVE